MYKEVDLGKDLMRLDFSDRNVVSIERVVRVESFSEFFGIENMPVLFSQQCCQFVEAVECNVISADIILSEINGFFKRNMDKFRQNKIDIGYFQTVFANSRLMQTVWEILNNEMEQIGLLKEAYLFLARLSYISDEFIDFFLAEDIVSVIIEAFIQNRVPEQYLCNEYASMALLNILTRYHTKDATYEHIIPLFTDLSHVLLSKYSVPRARVVTLGYVIALNTEDERLYSFLIHFFVANVDDDTCRLIATAMAHILKRCPAMLAMSSNIINTLLEMQNHACNSVKIMEAGGAVLKAAAAALLAAETDEARDSIVNSLSIQLLERLRGLANEKPSFFEPALEFIAVVMPCSFVAAVFGFYGGSEVGFLETVVIPRLKSGTLQEKLGCLKLLDRIVDVFPGSRLSIYDDVELFDVFTEILECSESALWLHTVSLLEKVLRDNARFESRHRVFLEEFFAREELIQAVKELIRCAPNEVKIRCRAIMRIPQILEIPIQEIGDVCEAYWEQDDI